MNLHMTDIVNKRPLCVDLDKTLVREDVFRSALLSWALRGFRPWNGFPPASRNGFKSWIYQNINLVSIEWHFNAEVISLICRARKDLRPVILVTGNSEEAGNFFAKEIPCITSILTSTENLTLKGRRKAIELQTLFGLNNFDYIGDSKVDIPVWEVCYQAFILTYPNRTYHKIMKKLQDREPHPVFLDFGEVDLLQLTSTPGATDLEVSTVGCSCLK